jgi:hypothetical protein
MAETGKRERKERRRGPEAVPAVAEQLVCDKRDAL